MLASGKFHGQPPPAPPNKHKLRNIAIHARNSRPEFLSASGNSLCVCSRPSATHARPRAGRGQKTRHSDADKHGDKHLVEVMVVARLAGAYLCDFPTGHLTATLGRSWWMGTNRHYIFQVAFPFVTLTLEGAVDTKTSQSICAKKLNPGGNIFQDSTPLILAYLPRYSKVLGETRRLGLTFVSRLPPAVLSVSR